MLIQFKRYWDGIRRLSGDDAYERYLQHFTEHHQQALIEGDVPLSKSQFFKEWQDKKWNAVKRCC